MNSYTTTTRSASPVEREEMRLARVALDHEELAEWLASRAKDHHEPLAFEEAA
jgi:hypothetical protein